MSRQNDDMDPKDAGLIVALFWMAVIAAVWIAMNAPK